MMVITTVETDNGALLPIGRQGEHDARKIWFDLTWLIESFGEGEAVLVHQRAKDEAPYICQTTQENNRLIWIIDANDTAYEGIGKAEIRWTVGGALAKTVIYKTSVLKSLTAGTVIPDPYESWYDEMIDYIDQLKVDSDARLVEAVESASESATNASASATDALTSAGTATTKAGEAAQSATQAAASAIAAAASASEASTSADRAEQAAHTAGYMHFYIDSNGELIFQRTEHVDVSFYLSNGDLFVRG